MIEQDPAAGSVVEEGTTVDIVVSTGPKQVPASLRAAPAGVGTGSSQAPATQAKSNYTSPKQAPTNTEAASQAVPISVLDDAQQESPTVQKASTTAQTASASSTTKTVQKEKKKEKK